jgi:hypothetical protein
MLDEYSIEQRATKIIDTRTKGYFSEVLSSYMAGNYRSAVVMLWSVVICDLLFKLHALVEYYDDQPAKEILDRINKGSERSSQWESELIKLVADKTQLLSLIDKENLEYLQQQRHLSAHPVINDDYQLHRPNRETVSALIRNALDGLLTKAPLLSQKIIDNLVCDLEVISELFIDENNLKTYLNKKYFSHFTPKIREKIFKALWKFVFRLEDSLCSKNRDINYKALCLLYQQNKEHLSKQIGENKEFFSSISESNEPIIYLIRFLAKNTGLYSELFEPTQIIIREFIEKNISKEPDCCLAWFVFNDLKEYKNWLIHKIDNEYISINHNTWIRMREIFDSEESIKILIELANRYYACSGSFNTADKRFNEAIRDNLDIYNLETLVDLIEKIETNNQTYGRWQASHDHKLIRNRVIEFEPNFNFNDYPQFNNRFI